VISGKIIKGLKPPLKKFAFTLEMRRVLTALILTLAICAVASAQEIDMSGSVSYNQVGGTVNIQVQRIENFRPLGSYSGTLRLQLWATSLTYTGFPLFGHKMAEVDLGQLYGQYYWSFINRTVAYFGPPSGVRNVVLVLAEWQGFSYQPVDWHNFGFVTFGAVAPPPLLPGPSINSAMQASGRLGRSFNYRIIASDSPTDFRATGLPSGLSIDRASGVISGTPLRAGTFFVGISATNANGTGTAILTLTIAKGTQTVRFSPAQTRSFKKGRTFELSAVATSGLQVRFTSNKPNILSIRGNTATIHRKGKVTVTAEQRGNSKYLSAKLRKQITIR
jgi:hypothetical protein